ncbi:MAG: nickel-dependent hydrogenase large subunit [Zoogloeaceae bacterium]|jgi:hypothetical protein|nr:nickel-dependent hydrogenase large subunit [Zoogloeaceae bacterium]
MNPLWQTPLVLTLARDARGGVCARAQWQPVAVERLLLRRSPEEAGPLVARLLTLCAQAHQGAAGQAVAALQETPAPQPAFDERIRVEAGRETLRRWLVDFPAVFGRRWLPEAFAEWHGLNTRQALDAFCQRHVYAMPAGDWLALDTAALRDWAATADTLPAAWLTSCWREFEYASGPDGQSAPPSAELLAWIGANAARLIEGDLPEPAPAHADLALSGDERIGLPARLLLARLRALAEICAGESSPCSGGERHGDIGLGWARTARGMLAHLVRIERGRLTGYRVLPPTLWNFGPQSLLPAMLKSAPPEQARADAERLVLLLDPCTAYRIDMPEGDHI